MNAVEYDCVFVSVEYRTGPEAKFPKGMEDMAAVVRHVHANAESLGINKERIVLWGTSMGTSHALGAAKILAAAGEADLVKVLILKEPVIYGKALDVPDEELNEDEKKNHVKIIYSNVFTYNADDKEKQLAERDPSIMVGRMSDEEVAKLPMSIVITSEFDWSQRDALVFADRLKSAGRLLELGNTASAIQGFENIMENPISIEFRAQMKEALHHYTKN